LDWGKVRFFLGEVLRNFTRNASMQATAIGTVAITIILLGSFLFVRAALAGMGAHLLDQIEISAYLSSDATTAEVTSIRHLLAADPRIESVSFVPKKQGLLELRDRIGSIDEPGGNSPIAAVAPWRDQLGHALAGLGFTGKEADDAIDIVAGESVAADPDAPPDLSAMLRRTIQLLGRTR